LHGNARFSSSDMLSRVNAEQHVEKFRCTLWRLERNGDFSCPSLFELKPGISGYAPGLIHDLFDLLANSSQILSRPPHPSSPHCVYLFPNTSFVMEIKQTAYFTQQGKVVLEVANNTLDLERVEEIRFASESRSVTSQGFRGFSGDNTWNWIESKRSAKAGRYSHASLHSKTRIIARD
jgi:hypothetical protein